MQKIGYFIPHIINNLGIENAVKLRLLRDKWDKIFEGSVKEHTFPKEIKDDTVVVIVNSSAWLNELSLLKEEFLKRLIPFGIKDVHFKFGKIYRSNNTYKNINRKEKISSEQEKWLNETLNKVTDQDIKEVMESIFKKYFNYINTLSKGA